MTAEHVPGRDAGQVMLYALSTCVWCKKTRHLLDELGVAYTCEYVDLLDGSEKARTMNIVHKWNPQGGFPTLMIRGNVIVGFQESAIREALKA